MEWNREKYRISDDPQAVDVAVVHNFLSNRSYWARGRPRAVVEKSVAHSLNFSLFFVEQQIGFARVVSDYAIFAWLADVWVDEKFRGQGLGKWLIACVIDHPELQGVKRFLLATDDAHGLYRGHGFLPLTAPERWMEKLHL